jgi:hypothetical protein
MLDNGKDIFNLLNMYRIIVVILLILFSSCGKTWVKDQKRKENSAVTLYAHFYSGFVKSITFENLETGKTYRNKRYGWGKEFFPRQYSFSFVMVANMPPGRYVLKSMDLYEKNFNKTITVDLDDPDGAFELEANNIIYLGDILLGYAGDKKNSSSSPDQNENRKIRRITGQIHELGSQEFIIANQNPYIPGNDVFRPGEEYFLDFIIAKESSLTRWSEIAKSRRARIEDLRKDFLE